MNDIDDPAPRPGGTKPPALRMALAAVLGGAALAIPAHFGVPEAAVSGVPLESRASDVRCWQGGVPIFQETAVASVHSMGGGLQVNKLDGSIVGITAGYDAPGMGSMVCVVRYRPDR